LRGKITPEVRAQVRLNPPGSSRYLEWSIHPGWCCYRVQISGARGEGCLFSKGYDTSPENGGVLQCFGGDPTVASSKLGVTGRGSPQSVYSERPRKHASLKQPIQSRRIDTFPRCGAVLGGELAFGLEGRPTVPHTGGGIVRISFEFFATLS
jgi:hypothetical protein